MKSIKEYIYETTDLGLAAAIVAVGYQDWDIKSQPNSKQKVFVISGLTEVGVNELERDYYSKSLTVDACTYSQSLKSLKTRVLNSI